MDKTEILKADNLSKTFSNESVQQHVLKNLNLEIYKGDFTVIMGNSGSGKSTLLYSLSGMDRPTIGTVTYYTGETTEISKFNNDKLAIFRKDHVGFVFQQNYLNDSMSALDNILVCGYLKDGNRKEIVERAKKLLRKVEMEERDWKKFPTQLSGGQQQRVAIARTLAMRPDIIFLDEPTSALDPELVSEVLNIIKKVADQGYTMLLVSHEMDFIRKISTRVIFLDGGKIIEDGKPQDVFENPRSRRARDFFDKMNILREPDYYL